MSKGKRISRKKFVRWIAERFGTQVRATEDAVRRTQVDPGKREQEQRQTEAHRKKEQKK